MQKEEKIRQSNFELLRIIAMIMIIFHHYMVHGGLIVKEFGTNKIIGTFLFSFGKIGVALFLLISGYFMIKSKFNIKRFFKIIAQVYFYIFLVLLIYVISEKRLPEDKWQFIFVFKYNVLWYWFITNYLIVFILSPLINKLLLKINRKVFLIGLLIGFIVLTFIKDITASIPLGVIWFIYLYCVGAYIRLYDIKLIIPEFYKKYLFLWIVIFFGFIYYKFLNNYNEEIFNNELADFITPNHLLSFLITLNIFMIFKNMTIMPNKIINSVGKSTFGIYLLHDGYFKYVMWLDILRTNKFYYGSPILLILHLLGCTLAIFIVGIVIEFIRINVFEKVIFENKLIKNIKKC